MRRQGEFKIRAVYADNLRAMCDRASGWSHNYKVEVGKTRATIVYSNPDEYGSPNPIEFRFPIVPDQFGGETDNPVVILHLVSDRGGRDAHDRDAAYQSLDSMILCDTPMARDAEGAWHDAPKPAMPDRAEVLDGLAPLLGLVRRLAPDAPELARGDELINRILRSEES